MRQEEAQIIDEIIDLYVPSELKDIYRLRLIDAAQMGTTPTPVVVTDYDLSPIKEYASISHFIAEEGLFGYTESGLKYSARYHCPVVGEGRLLVFKDRLENGQAKPHKSRRVSFRFSPNGDGTLKCSKTGVIIDEDAIELVRGMNVQIEKKPNNPQYCIIYNDTYKNRLHRHIMGVGTYKENSKVVVDHKDRNGLDCRRANLRVTTQQMNVLNKKRLSPRKYGKSSKYMGVSVYNRRPNSSRKRITMETSLFGQRIKGSYKTEERAAKIYDIVHLYMAGEYATTNFPQEQYPDALVERFGRLFLKGKKTYRDFL